jgi:DNA-binding LacI/PurR family transcriptional regulator
MIFVYPDSFIRGVAAVLREHRTRVPEQVLVVSHRNAESQIYIPFPMVWLTVKAQDFALKLIEQIDLIIQLVGCEIRIVLLSKGMS